MLGAGGDSRHRVLAQACAQPVEERHRRVIAIAGQQAEIAPGQRRAEFAFERDGLDRSGQLDAREAFAQHGEEMGSLACRRGQGESGRILAGVPRRRRRWCSCSSVSASSRTPSPRPSSQPASSTTRRWTAKASASVSLDRGGKVQPAGVARGRDEQRAWVGADTEGVIEGGEQCLPPRRASAARGSAEAAPKVVMPAAASVATMPGSTSISSSGSAASAVGSAAACATVSVRPARASSSAAAAVGAMASGRRNRGRGRRAAASCAAHRGRRTSAGCRRCRPAPRRAGRGSRRA